jgi:hypothetical protein
MFQRLALLLLFWTSAPVATFATSVFIAAKEQGQGFAFPANGICHILVPLHVLGIDANGPAPTSVQAQATVNGALARFISPPERREWIFKDLDIGLLVANDLQLCQVNERQTPRSTSPQIVYRDASGTIEYLPIKVTGQSGNEVLVSDANGACTLLQGRSGSIVLGDANRILGMLRATKDCRAGHVVDFDRVNTALSGVEFGLRVPLHPLSYDLMKAAREANESSFNSLLNQIGDANTRDGSGNNALERIADADFYLFQSAVGMEQPRPGEDYDDLIKRVCSIWMETRLRMVRTLLARGARVDADGGVGWTPLMTAVGYDEHCDETPIVQLLLDSGGAPNHVYRSDVDGTIYLDTLLMHAVEFGLPTTVDVLLKKGADPNMRSDSGSGRNITPLMALALDDSPSDTKGFPDSSGSCWDTDNVKVAKFRLLAKVSDLDLKVQSSDYRTRDFANLTVERVLRKRLGGGCNNSSCDGKGRAGPERCLERMLGALP